MLIVGTEKVKTRLMHDPEADLRRDLLDPAVGGR